MSKSATSLDKARAASAPLSVSNTKYQPRPSSLSCNKPRVVSQLESLARTDNGQRTQTKAVYHWLLRLICQVNLFVKYFTNIINFNLNYTERRRLMKNTMEPSRIKNTYLLLFMLLFAMSGCAGPKIAADLLAKTRTNEKPLTKYSSIVNVSINPDINNYEKLDESVKQSLEIALANANIFGADSLKPFRIDAKILIASQSPMNFGSFKGKLEIRYVVHDSDDMEVLDKTISTVAGSDKWFFSGFARHRRSRAVNISKNVLQFVDIMQNLLKK